MKLTANTALDAFSLLAPLITKSQISPWSSNFLFLKGALGVYNRQMGARLPFQHDLSVDVMTPADGLMAVLRNAIPEQEVTLELKDTVLHVKSKGIRAKLPITALPAQLKGGITKIEEEIAGQKNWAKVPANFREGLDLCSITTIKNTSNIVLSCVFIHGPTMYSTDDLRISRFHLSDKGFEDGEFALSVDNTKVLAAGPLLERWKCFEGRVHFVGSKETPIIYSCSMVFLKEAFPRKGVKIDDSFRLRGKVIALPVKELREALGIVIAFAPGDLVINKRAHLTIHGTKIQIRSASGTQAIERDLRAEGNKETLDLPINPVFLQEALRGTTGIVAAADDKIAMLKGESLEVVMELPIESEKASS